MRRTVVLITALALCLAAVLGSCGASEGKATLYADFTAGSAIEEQILTKELAYSGELTPAVLADGLSEWSGLDFKIVYTADENKVTVNWAKDSALVAGRAEGKQKEDFTFFDVDSLRWFMMDSLWRTLTMKLGVEVYYASEDGGALVLEALNPVAEFPADIPYMGKAFYMAHKDDLGDMSQQEAWDALAAKLEPQLKDGLSLMVNLEDEIDGEHCWTFILGENLTDRFVGREHFAVTDGGTIYVMDMNDGKYVPYNQ